MQDQKVEIVGYDCGWGCRDYGCEDGPLALPIDQILQHLQKAGIAAKWRGPLGIKFFGNHTELNTKEKTLPLVREAIRRLAHHTSTITQNGHIPIVIGGDHSSAIGTWSGIVHALNAHQKFGLIWIDAHLDAHTHETSHQGKWGGWWHGQPVSALLGHGLPEFKNLMAVRKKISPEHMTIIGYHSFEPAEETFIRQQSVKTYSLADVQRLGFETVFKEALTRATAGTDGFGLSIDLDAFAGSEAPGVGTAEEDGLSAAPVLPILKSLAAHEKFKALEIAEFNPAKDQGQKTAHLIENLIKTIFTKD